MCKAGQVRHPPLPIFLITQKSRSLLSKFRLYFKYKKQVLFRYEYWSADIIFCECPWGF
jgi:hypothetical protein